MSKTAKRFGISLQNLFRRASAEGWKIQHRGRPRDVIKRNEVARAEVAKHETEFRAREALLERQAEVLTIDLRHGEKLAGSVLQRHSTRTKIAISELVVQTVEDLRSPDVRPKDRALALASLKAVCDRLYGWDKEPDLHELKIAETAAINLTLIGTPPEKLRQMALAKYGSLTLTPEHKGQGAGHSPVREDPESPSWDGPLGEKGDPEKLAEEKQGYPGAGVDHCVDHGVDHRIDYDHHDQNSSARSWKSLKPELDPILKPQVPEHREVPGNSHSTANPPTPSMQFGSPPLSPEERRKRQLEELDRLRAKWRGR
jgi:hypothetical protein